MKQDESLPDLSDQCNVGDLQSPPARVPVTCPNCGETVTSNPGGYNPHWDVLGVRYSCKRPPPVRMVDPSEQAVEDMEDAIDAAQASAELRMEQAANVHGAPPPPADRPVFTGPRPADYVTPPPPSHVWSPKRQGFVTRMEYEIVEGHPFVDPQELTVNTEPAAERRISVIVTYPPGLTNNAVAALQRIAFELAPIANECGCDLSVHVEKR